MYRELELLVPPGEKIDSAAMATFLRSIMEVGDPIAFELVGRGRSVSVRFAGSAEGLAVIRDNLRAFFPTATIREDAPSVMALWATVAGDPYALEFGLAREFMLPLRDAKPTADPLIAFVAALSDVRSNELALIQVLFDRARHPWGESAVRAVTSPDGTPFFIDAPELTQFAIDKFCEPLCAACVRLVVRAAPDRAEDLLRRIAGAFTQFGSPDRNELVSLAFEDREELAFDVLTRCTRRSGMILSLSELCSLVRVPSEHVRSTALVRTIETEATLPATVLGQNGASLGEGKHKGAAVPVRMGTESRLQHMYVIGASGTGKSTLLVNLVVQDIEAGHGVGVLDPHGDLIDEILARIPPGRSEDVILFDPADPEWITGWNILGAHSDLEKELLASDLVAVFKRLSTSWGDQMSVVLGNAVLAFLESSRGGTLVDLRKFLLDESFRKNFLETVSDDHVRSFWTEEFELLAGKKPQAPILTRLDTFLRSKLVRAAVTERDKALNFREIIDTKKIFLGRLSQGAIGEENAALLGSLLVSKFHQVSLSRQDTAEADRAPFFLYLDEFHHMATPSMASLFSGVRKYRLGLTIAHQDLYQLHATAPEVERSALTNAFTRVVFRVSDEDARKLERGMGDFTADDLTDLGRGQAICRVGRRDEAFRLRTLPMPSIADDAAQIRRDTLREISGMRFGRRRGAPVPSVEISARPAPPPVRVAGPTAMAVPQEAKPPTLGSPRVAEDRPDATRGRGGPLHKYLQGLIRQAGQSHGFKTAIEHELPDGKRVDVLLTRDELSIACEIAGFSTIENELQNLGKCVEASFTHVCSVSLDAAFLRKLEAAHMTASPSADQTATVQFLSPEELMAFLPTLAGASEVRRVAGYAVHVRQSGTMSDELSRRKTIADVMMKSIRRVRENK
jgi:hypothetical protein